jgi:pilus assembly protein CpaF
VSDLLDYTLIRKLQGQVADAQLADRRQLQASGQPIRTVVDEQQQAQSIIRRVVSRHLQDMLGRREELPADPAFETRLRAAIFSAIYGAGELQELLDDELVENIDINGCEQTWVTYAGGIKELWRPVAERRSEGPSAASRRRSIR